MNDILTVEDVAKLLRVSKVKVTRMCRTEELAAFRVGRLWRLHRADVEKWLASQTSPKVA